MKKLLTLVLAFGVAIAGGMGSAVAQAPAKKDSDKVAQKDTKKKDDKKKAPKK